VVVLFTNDSDYEFYLARVLDDVKCTYSRVTRIRINYFESRDLASNTRYKLVNKQMFCPHTSIKGQVPRDQFVLHASSEEYVLTDDAYDDLVQVVNRVQDDSDDGASSSGSTEDREVCPGCQQEDLSSRFLLCDTCNSQVHVACSIPAIPASFDIDNDDFFCDGSSGYTVCARGGKGKRLKKKKVRVDD